MEGAYDFSGFLTIMAIAGGVMVVAGFLYRARQRLLVIGVQQAAVQIEGLLLRLADPAPHDVLVHAADDGRHDERWRADVRARTDDAVALGFVVLGDFEDRSLHKAMPEQALPIVRALRSDNGEIVLGITGREHQGAVVITVELGSEVRAAQNEDDVRFVETMAMGDMPMLGQGPRIDLEKLPSQTSISELVARQQTRIAAERAVAVLVPALTVDDVIQRYHRRVALTAAHRASLSALITHDELSALGGAEPAVIDMVYAELVRRAADRRSR